MTVLIILLSTNQKKTEVGTVASLQTEEPVDAPYLFKPDDSVARFAYPLGIWQGNWLEYFRDFHIKALEEKQKSEKK